MRKLTKNKKNSKKNKKEKGEKRGGNREILVVTYMLSALFLGLIGYFVYFMAVQSKDVINNSYNQRQTILAKRVVRGKILGRKGEVLAETVSDGKGGETRSYPYGRLFTHVVGHSSQGKTGVELSENFNLLTSNDNPVTNFQKKLDGKKTIGDNAITTLDVDLQRVAYDALGNHKGAIVVMEPSTGKILAMVSKPDYDPSPASLDIQWNSLVADANEESCLVNRATQGLYPPGSTFKIMTTLAYMRQSKDTSKFSYQCQGTEKQDGIVVNCYRNHVHGNLNLQNAFAKSCNSCFAYLGTKLNTNEYRKICESFYFNTKLPTKMVHNKSSFVLNKDSNKEEIMHTAMGQGKTQITPLHAAMIVSTIANKGVMMQPYVVEKLESNSGTVVRETKETAARTIMTEEETKELTTYMTEVIRSGTATSLSSLSYPVAGKTGSAEYDATKNSHAWFLGFAPANKPKVAVAVIVEGAGTGSEYAVPIAKKVFQSFLGN